MDVRKNLYYDCFYNEHKLSRQIEEHKKIILRLQKEMEENKKIFKENFDLTLDRCINMSYNEYIKKKGGNCLWQDK